MNVLLEFDMRVCFLVSRHLIVLLRHTARRVICAIAEAKHVNVIMMNFLSSAF